MYIKVKNMHLSVIVPAYNEEKNLANNINKFNDYLRCQKYDYEIIVVNDGSRDKTAEIADALSSKIKNIKIINNKINRGKGFAVKQGLLSARGNFKIFIDADGATSIEHMDKIWPLFNKGFDIIIGSRNKKDARESSFGKAQPYWKIFLGKGGNTLIRLLVTPGIWDTQCGFKAFTKRAAENIMPKLKINRWMFDVEILVLARHLNYKIGKIPVFWVDSGSSRVGVKGYFVSLKEIIKIKFNLLTGRYK